MQSTVFPLAWNTVRELVRSKLLYNLLGFAALLIASSLLIAQLTIGEWDRIIVDQGLSAIEIGGALIAVVVGVNLIAGEIERRTIFPVLAKPVGRGAFVVGRYLGLLLVLLANTALMLGLLVLMLRMAASGLSATAAWAAALIAVELALLAAVALLFSSFSTPMLAAGFSFSVFLIGHLVSDLRSFGQRSHSAAARLLSEIVYQALPNLELLNLKAQAANHVPVTLGYVGLSAAYGLGYAAALLAFAALLFARRDLK